MSEPFQETLAEAASDPQHFRGLTFSGKRKELRLSARPILVKGQPAIALTRYEKGQTTAKTVRWADWKETVRHLAEEPGLDFFHVRRDDGDWHVRIARKGRVLISRGRPAPLPAPSLGDHDRPKSYALTPENAAPLLRVLEVLDDQGRIRPSMQAKYRQINGFLALLDPLLPETPPPSYLVCDCGCGSAHLSFAVYEYLFRQRHFPVRLIGLDRNAALIARNTLWRDRLGWTEGMSFVATDLSSFDPPAAPDLVLALHVCDTASDVALARSVRWQARAILAAPCCRHTFGSNLESEPMAAVLRHGILRERLADLINDALRAAALRACGYAVRVVEFVSPSDTPKNLLLRAVRLERPDPDAAEEYRALKQFWQVVPPIETCLKAEGLALP